MKNNKITVFGVAKVSFKVALGMYIGVWGANIVIAVGKGIRSEIVKRISKKIEPIDYDAEFDKAVEETESKEEESKS